MALPECVEFVELGLVDPLTPGQRPLAYAIYNVINTGFYLQQLIQDAAGMYNTIKRKSITEDFLAIYREPNSSFYAIRDTTHNIVLSACKVQKLGENSYFVSYLCSHPLYLRAGATKLLLTYLCLALPGSKIYLEVATDSYPFISFYHRFLLYADLGFQFVDCPGFPPALLQYFNPTFGPGALTMHAKGLHFLSKLHGTAPTEETYMDIETEYEPIDDFCMDIDSIHTPPLLANHSKVTISNFFSIDLKDIGKNLCFVRPVVGHRYCMSVDTSLLNQNLLFVESLLLHRDRIRAFQKLGRTVSEKPLKQIYVENYIRKCEEFTQCMNARRQAMEEQAKRSVQNLGILAHSGYVLNPANTGIETFALPENIEVVIFNTPGYLVSGEQLSANWNFNSKYLNDIPIEILKQYFPGMRAQTCGKLQEIGALAGCGNPRSCTYGGCENYYIPAPSLDPAHTNPCHPLNKKYIQAISGSILFTFLEFPTNKIHCHSYGPGDRVPDLIFSAPPPSHTSVDIASAIAGIYSTDNSSFGCWATQDEFQHVRNSINIQGSYVFNGESYQILDSVMQLGRPNTPRIRSFETIKPDTEFKRLSEILANIQENMSNPDIPAEANLSGRLRQASLHQRRNRIVILGCGSCATTDQAISVQLNETMRKLSEFQLTKQVNISNIRNYRETLTIFGHALKHEIVSSLKIPLVEPTGPPLDVEIAQALLAYDQSKSQIAESEAEFQTWLRTQPPVGGKRSRKIRRGKRRCSRRMR